MEILSQVNGISNAITKKVYGGTRTKIQNFEFLIRFPKNNSSARTKCGIAAG
jgi:hypothetical protein